MSNNTTRCGLDGCLPTAIPRRTRHLKIWVDIDDRDRQPDELLLGLYNDGDDAEDGVEAWMTVEEAEKVYHLLGSAIRRHTAYRQIAL